MASLLPSFIRTAAAYNPFQSTIFSVDRIPDNPFFDAQNPNLHAGIEKLLDLMGRNGLKFYRSRVQAARSGPLGLIAPNDIVLIKVNAQWKYRGATNSDVVRGLIQCILDHPDGFMGEVVIIENGQGRGSLACDTSSSYTDNKVHANAVDESHSFLYLVDKIFKDLRVSAFLLDPVRSRFIGANDHATNGYRTFENVSYPCFTTNGGFRIELKEGVWNGAGYDRRLKLINIPVLKTHGGSEITGALKHFYGVLSMSDGKSDFRHYVGLGETCGKMVASVRAPVLNIMDAIWVSHKALSGFPATSTFKANRLVASQDPLALDYWTAKNILYAIDRNASHNPDNSTIQGWMNTAADMINGRRGLFRPDDGLFLRRVTKKEENMLVLRDSTGA
jgi:uncharacterized protein (DUF362 family)